MKMERIKFGPGEELGAAKPQDKKEEFLSQMINRLYATPAKPPTLRGLCLICWCRGGLGVVKGRWSLSWSLWLRAKYGPTRLKNSKSN